jgi:poly(hydroxyalkanoate) depolymerase family esterase
MHATDEPDRRAVGDQLRTLGRRLLGTELTTDASPRPPGDGAWQRRSHTGVDGVWPYAVYTPPGRGPWRGAPLMVVLHGCTQDPEDIAAGTRMNEVADERRFVVAYPQQVRQRNRRSCWNWFRPEHQQRGRGEPAAIAAITAAVADGGSPWRVDRRRVYVVGMSAGGAMANVLGATYPDRFAAIGVHSGVGYRVATSARDAFRVMRRGMLGGPAAWPTGALDAMGPHARVVPAIVVHGTDDRTVRPVNGAQTVEQWMRTNRSVAPGRFAAEFDEPDERWQAVDGASTVTVRRWTDSRGVVVHEYRLIDGLGHAWSGGAPDGSYTDPTGPDVTRAMYDFLERHRLDSRHR